MRVTQLTVARLLSVSINRAYERLGEAVQRIGTGKRIQRLSDDVIAATVVMRNRLYSSEAKLNEVVAQRLNDTLMAFDGALGGISEVLQTLRELVVQAASGTLDTSSMETIATQIEMLKGQLLQIANSRYGDAFIFSGTKTTARPFEIRGSKIIYVGGRNRMVYINGEPFGVGVTGRDVFLEGVNLFELLELCSSKVRSNDVEWLSKVALREIDRSLDRVLQARAFIGAQSEAVRGVQSQLASLQTHYESAADLLEGADIASEAITASLTRTSLYAVAALASKLLPTNVIDALA